MPQPISRERARLGSARANEAARLRSASGGCRPVQGRRGVLRANDAFATVKIALKAETEDNYRAVLTWLCRLLEADFPRSYEIAFRSPAKHYLPVKGLTKKGVHQLFANATGYPELRPFIAQYARLAMREHEWYTNIDEAAPAMPGTFAVFALALRLPLRSWPRVEGGRPCDLGGG
ncbi:DUF6138 family protein [Burkholderia ubonensis]|uniref:DUF6138 family protein n=1 Tax=Burkholderia ubonensis TaxID=101571 RepID=UPI001E43C838|nr:DUF6138 family protein [Burkholderia ubonensis]